MRWQPGWLILLLLLSGGSVAAGADPVADPLPAGALARLGTTRFRPTPYPTSAVLSPDGRLVGVAGPEGVVLMAAATGKAVRALPGGTAGVRELAFSPDGKLVAGLGPEVIHLWDVASGRPCGKLQERQVDKRFARLSSLAFSGNGKYLAAGGVGDAPGGMAHVWEVATGNQVGALEVLANQQIHVVLSSDGKVLAAWGSAPAGDGQTRAAALRTVQLWDVPAARELQRIKVEAPDKGHVSVAALSPDGKLLAVPSGPAAISVWDVAHGSEPRRLAGPAGCSLLAFSSDGKLLAAGTGTAVLLWDTTTWQRCGGSQHAQDCRLTGLDFLAGGRVVACGIDGQEICLWDAASGKGFSPQGGHQQAVLALGLTKADRELLSVDAAGRVWRWDTATGKEVGHVALQGQPAQRFPPLRGLVLSSDGQYAAAPFEEGVRLWQVAPPRVVGDFKARASFGRAVLTFSSDGTHLAAHLPGEQAIVIWDTTARRELQRWPVPAAVAESAAAGRPAFSPNGSLLALAGREKGPAGPAVGKVYLWHTATGKQVCTIPESKDQLPVLAFSADGKVLATAAGTEIVLRAAATGMELRRLESSSAVEVLAFSPDGRTLATATARPDHAVDLWELATGRLRAHFGGHAAPITCLLFAAGGNLLASGSADTTVVLWDASGRVLTEPGVEHEPADLWNDLGSANAATGFEAIGELVARPKMTVLLLKRRLPPAELAGLSPVRIRKLIAELDSPRFTLRAQATRALEKQGRTIQPELRRALEGKITLEQRRRIEKLLARLGPDGPTPDELRMLRGVEVLERVGTPDARQALEALARGAAGNPLTEQAQAALRRLQ
jgi:WD40 repeat protein